MRAVRKIDCDGMFTPGEARTMDGGSFAPVTRSLTGALTGSTTRRAITQLLSGLAFGGPLGLQKLSQAEAKCKK